MAVTAKEKHVSPEGQTWRELEKSICTPEEIVKNRLGAKIMVEIIKARQERGVTQRELSEIIGIPQPHISRLENGNTNTSIDTVMKVLASLGKTLKVVDLEK